MNIPYVSIDIETTGLDPEYCQIIEIGAVIEDWVSPIAELPKWHCYVVHDRVVGQPFGLAMNHAILKKVAERPEGCIFLRPVNAMAVFQNWLVGNNLDPHKVLATGKNFASFDLQFLKRLPNFSSHIGFHHRSIDPAMLYWKPGEEPPSTKTCMERAGIEGEVAHTAIEDARTVIRLIRYRACANA